MPQPRSDAEDPSNTGRQDFEKELGDILVKCKATADENKLMMSANSSRRFSTGGESPVKQIKKTQGIVIDGASLAKI